MLVSRKLKDSVIHDQAQVLERVRLLLREGVVVTCTGKALPMQARSILLHGDTPGSVELARTVRREIETAGWRVVPVSCQAA